MRVFNPCLLLVNRCGCERAVVNTNYWDLSATHRSDMATQLSVRHWLPSHQLSRGALVPSSGALQSCVGVARGLISYFGLGFDLRALCSPFVSKLFHAAWRHKPQGIYQWRGDICSGPGFHVQPPCRIHYRMVMAL